MIKRFGLLIVLCVFSSLMPALYAFAATIVVNAQIGETGCDLIEAINSANNNAVEGGCVAGGAFGDDLIVLSPAIDEFDLGFQVLNTSGFAGGWNLPEITSPITIQGLNESLQAIKRPDFGADNYRHFLVGSGGNLKLNHVSLQGGRLDLFNGGAILVYCDGKVTLENVEISNNTAPQGGAVAIGNFGCGSTQAELTVTGSVFSDNTAIGQPGLPALGGAVYQSAGSRVSVFDSTISNNVAATGGGLAIGGTPSADLSLINVTITENQATGSGGGIYMFTNDTSPENSLVMINNILSGNTAGAGERQELSVRNVLTLDEKTVVNNIVGTNNATFLESVDLIEFLSDNILMTSDAPGSLPLNRIIGPLRDNGGLTQSHALVANSPAINSGLEIYVKAVLPSLITFPGCRGDAFSASTDSDYRPDQLGQTRPVGSECDIGALESPFEEDDQCYVVPTSNNKTAVFCL